MSESTSDRIFDPRARMNHSIKRTAKRGGINEAAIGNDLARKMAAASGRRHSLSAIIG